MAIDSAPQNGGFSTWVETESVTSCDTHVRPLLARDNGKIDRMKMREHGWTTIEPIFLDI